MNNPSRLTVPAMSDAELMDRFRNSIPALQSALLTAGDLADWLGHCPDRLAELVNLYGQGRREVEALLSGAKAIQSFESQQLRTAMHQARHHCVACPQGGRS